jgi:hypothetical protein
MIQLLAADYLVTVVGMVEAARMVFDRQYAHYWPAVLQIEEPLASMLCFRDPQA